jgi:hypothetical protein
MARSQQRQLDLVRDLTRALSSGELNPEEVRIALSAEPYAASLIPEFADLLEGAQTQEELAQTLHTILVRAEGELARLPALADQRVEPMDSKEVAAIAQAHTQARASAVAMQKKAAGSMRSLIERSVSAYAMTDSKSIIERLSSRAAAAAEEAPTKEAAVARVQEAVGRELPEREAQLAIANAIGQNQQELATIWEEARASRVAREIITQNPTLPTIARATQEILDRKDEIGSSHMKDVALQKAREEVVLLSPAAPEQGWGNITAVGGFFRSLPNTNTIQRALAPAADALLSVFPQETREKIVSSVFSGAFERGVDAITQKLGEKAFVNTHFAIGSGLIAADDQKAASTSALSGVSKLFGDTLGAVFKKPMDERAIAYLTEIHERAMGVASWQHAYVYHAYPLSPHAFHLELLSDLGSWAVRFGARKAAGGAAKAAAGKVVGEGAKRGAVAALGKLGLSIVAAPLTLGTSFIAQAALWLGTTALGKLWGGIKSLLGGLTGGGGDQRGTDWAIAGVIGAVVLLPMLFFFTGDVSRTAPLATSVGGFGESAACDPETDPDCAAAFCDSSKQDCRWPTPCGCVTQGPNNGVDTHARLNAIDIGTSRGGSCQGASHIDVFATHDGKVEEVVSRFGENQFQSGNYGNYVKISGQDAQGKTFYTLYAHLWKTKVVVGARVKAGQPIGQTNNNGTSFGEHLHYELQQGPDIGTILPVAVPHCQFGACPVTCW